MSYKPRSLFRLIEELNRSVFLPHIQRPFVWDEEQMERLFDSLMRNYPIQTLLFWRTNQEIKTRKFMSSIDWDANLHDYYDTAKSNLGVEKTFVLDGQQRLQTLYAIFSGSIRSMDGHSERYAYFDVTNGEPRPDIPLLYPLQFSSDSLALPNLRICDLIGRYAQKNAEEIADELNDKLDEILEEDPEVHKKRQRRVRSNIGQLMSLLREEKHFWVQELDGVANDFPYKKVLDIFVRVNSGGTKLSAADLMFAAMKEGWADVEARIEEIVDLLNENRLNFDKNLVLKCIVTATNRGAELDPEKFTSGKGEQLLHEVEENWEKIEGTFQQLRDMVVNELKLFGDKVVRSYNSFVPLFDYLYHNPKPTETDRALMRGYYYKSQLFNWYGQQTDGILDAMHSIVGRHLPTGFPIVLIKEYFGSSRRATVELTPDALNMRLRYIILNLIYVEKHGSSPFNVRFNGNEPHIDHIYPQSQLKKHLGLDASEINDLGNYRFVGAIDNIRKRAELPNSYFLRLKQAGINIASHLLLPAFADHPEKLRFDTATYRQFRDQRRQEIFEIASRIVNPELL